MKEKLTLGLALLFTLAAPALDLPQAVSQQLRRNDALTWSGPLAPRPIRDQGQYPYCAYYAMVSYLELWAATDPLVGELPELSPAYLAVAYNAFAANSAQGARLRWLVPIVDKFGAIPEGSLPGRESTVAWPLADWREQIATLLPAFPAARYVYSTYRHPSVPEEFTGEQYLHDRLHIDFAGTRFFTSPAAHTANLATNPGPPEQLRYDTYARNDNVLGNLAANDGIYPGETDEHASDMVRNIEDTLRRGRPALLQMDLAATNQPFRTYRIVDESDLNASPSHVRFEHVLVAIGECSEPVMKNPVCQRFATEMRQRAIRECVVMQNSWGDQTNAEGLVCLVPSALERMVSVLATSPVR